MLSNEYFVYQTLINNLFFLRTIREFCLHIQLSFLTKNVKYIDIAEGLSKKCAELGDQYIFYADGNVSQEAIDDDFIVTPYTLACEKMTERLFDVDLATNLTERELEIIPGEPHNISDELVDKLNDLNRKTLPVIKNFITFITEIYELEINNKLFSFSYPHLLKYMIDEAQIYQNTLKRLIAKLNVDPSYITNFEYNFITSLMDSAMYIRSFVNPTANDIFIKAQSYVMEFNNLLKEYKASSLSPENQKKLSNKTFEVVNRYSLFLADIIEKVLKGEVYFIAEATFLDNLYTEVNYFKSILKQIKKEDLGE